MQREGRGAGIARVQDGPFAGSVGREGFRRVHGASIHRGRARAELPPRRVGSSTPEGGDLGHRTHGASHDRPTVRNMTDRHDERTEQPCGTGFEAQCAKRAASQRSPRLQGASHAHRARGAQARRGVLPLGQLVVPSPHDAGDRLLFADRDESTASASAGRFAQTRLASRARKDAQDVFSMSQLTSPASISTWAAELYLDAPSWRRRRSRTPSAAARARIRPAGSGSDPARPQARACQVASTSLVSAAALRRRTLMPAPWSPCRPPRTGWRGSILAAP